jgi:hypothetical protein
MHLVFSLFHTEFVVMCVMYFLAAFCIPKPTDSLALKLKALYRFCAVFMFYLTPDSYINETGIFFKDLFHTFLGPILTFLHFISSHSCQVDNSGREAGSKE